MSQNYITVADLYKEFSGEFLNATERNVKNKIITPKMYQAGLELSQIFLNSKINSLIYWGELEADFLKTLTTEEQVNRLVKIFQAAPPLLIISCDFELIEVLLQASDQTNNLVPIIKSQFNSSLIATTINPWLARKLAKNNTIHGVLVNIFGEGVLILGSAGIGKSELAMELILKNHLFVGDDAIDISVVGNDLWGKANKAVADFIEIRGLGILDVKRMYGLQRLLKNSRINLVVELKKETELVKENIQLERLGSKLNMKPLMGIELPHYIVPVSYGRKISDIIESAVIDFKLKHYEKYHAFTEFENRISAINRGKEKED